MRLLFLLAVLGCLQVKLSAQVKDAFGIPQVGTGKAAELLNPKSAGAESDPMNLFAAQVNLFSATANAYQQSMEQWNQGLISLHEVIQLHKRRVLTGLEIKQSKAERVRLAEDELREASDLFNRVDEMARVGARGGDATSRFEAEAHLWDIARLWLLERQKGIPSDETGIPTGIVNGVAGALLEKSGDQVADVSLAQAKALENAIEATKHRWRAGMAGLEQMQTLRRAHTELLLASSEDRDQQLEILQEALVGAMTDVETVDALRKAGGRGGDAAQYYQAVAEMHHYRLLWLKTHNSPQ